ncbi:AAA family ATPase [Paenibacillus pabuli]|uniref:AAA family ATPase n=1 Tax=Paenibacillus pabuli TaxID=1472 RepID=UPI0032421CD9
MYLKSVRIINFRKFGLENNKIEFVDAKSYLDEKKDNDINIAPTTTLIVGKNNAGKTTIINALDKLINRNGDYKANDFNFSYLTDCQTKCDSSSVKDS